MAANRLPPQAYTRATLILAYDWLKLQPESTRKMVDTSDSIVALYLQTQRYKAKSFGGSSNPHKDGHSKDPQQSEMNFRENRTDRFQSELQSLAKGFDDFDNPTIKKPPAKKRSVDLPPSAFPGGRVELNPHQRLRPQSPARVPSQGPTKNYPANAPAVAPPVPSPQLEDAPLDLPEQPPNEQLNLGVLDRRTLEILHETQAVMNLSSEAEAMRLLIAMGFERIRSLVDSK